jgi:putative ABC transport system permease protein
LLYSVTPVDAPTFAAVAMTLFVTVGGAIYFPARRATRVSPATALRSD